jgi:hypothetical protein
VDVTDLFFSEYGEPDGGNHKYLEIYNGTGDVVSLDDVVILGNYNGNPWSETFTFQAGATVAAGDVYIVANSEADEAILALADETHAYGDPWYITSFNGDDVRALAQINGTDTTIIDIIGTLDGGDPGSGWDVAGVTNGTQNHVLVRKSTVTVGNSGNWTSSSGTNEDDSEWHVLDHNNWVYLGSHPHDLYTVVDLDNNGTQNILDLNILIKLIVSNGFQEYECLLESADVNYDGQLTIIDVILLAQTLLND